MTTTSKKHWRVIEDIRHEQAEKIKDTGIPAYMNSSFQKKIRFTAFMFVGIIIVFFGFVYYKGNNTKKHLKTSIFGVSSNSLDQGLEDILTQAEKADKEKPSSMGTDLSTFSFAESNGGEKKMAKKKKSSIFNSTKNIDVVSGRKDDKQKTVSLFIEDDNNNVILKNSQSYESSNFSAKDSSKHSSGTLQNSLFRINTHTVKQKQIGIDKKPAEPASSDFYPVSLSAGLPPNPRNYYLEHYSSPAVYANHGYVATGAGLGGMVLLASGTGGVLAFIKRKKNK